MNKIILFLLCFLLGSSFSTFAQGRDREIKISRQQESPVKTVKVRGKGKIKNVVFMIGDGMSLAHMYSTWAANKGKLNLENCQTVGLAKTYCYDRLITDSGAAGTALATGHKTRYHAVGVDPEGKPLLTLTDLAAAKSKSTGVVVTCRLNDATPAAFCAHNSDRDQAEALIADYAGCGVDFIFGGGKRYFCERKDGRNILEEMKALGYQTPENQEQLDAIQTGKVFEWAAADGETLVVVTADHETGGLTLVGGSLPEGEIIGKFSTGDHSGVMVPVYAFGPGAELFTGIYENTDIFEKIKYLLKL